MKKLLCGLAILAVLFSFVAPAHAWRRGRGFGGPHVFIGAPFWWGPGWGPYWYPYPYDPVPPVVVREEPTVYIQQQTQASPSAPQGQQYWYYCADTKTYYPYVQQCPAGWLQVVPQAPPGQ